MAELRAEDRTSLDTVSDTLLDDFAALRVTADDFDHAAHVRLAWAALERWPLPAAMAWVDRSLRRFATAHGAPERYHATVTWAFVLLIEDRRTRVAASDGGDFAAFRRANPDLFEGDVMERWYRPETLASERARRGFVWPDRPTAPVAPVSAR